MLIAEQKKKENIAEYILYMWQMEDLIRGSELKLDSVMKKVFPDADSGDEVVLEYRAWFAGIIDEMERDGLQSQGHLETVRKHIQRLSELHQSLITVYQDQEYIELYKKSAEDIHVLKNKSGSEKLSEVEVCLTGLYGLLLLRIQKAEISSDTIKAMNRISKAMAYLSEAFKKRENGELGLSPERSN